MASSSTSGDALLGQRVRAFFSGVAYEGSVSAIEASGHDARDEAEPLARIRYDDGDEQLVSLEMAERLLLSALSESSLHRMLSHTGASQAAAASAARLAPPRRRRGSTRTCARRSRPTQAAGVPSQL